MRVRVDSTDTFGTSPLVRGARGADVVALQERLKEAHVYRGGTSGIFDGKTFRAVRAYQRQHDFTASGMIGPRTLLPVRPITALDGWCEDPADRRYNRAIRISPGQPGDKLWRSDALYDLIIEIDHNTQPRVAGRGSAVFLHVARPHRSATAGCVAFAAPDLRRLLGRFGPKTRILIQI